MSVFLFFQKIKQWLLCKVLVTATVHDTTHDVLINPTLEGLEILWMGEKSIME